MKDPYEKVLGICVSPIIREGFSVCPPSESVGIWVSPLIGKGVCVTPM